MKHLLFFFLLLICCSCEKFLKKEDEFQQKGFSSRNGATILFVYSAQTDSNELKKYGDQKSKKNDSTIVHFFNNYAEMPSKLKEMTDEKMKKYWIGTYIHPPAGNTKFMNSSVVDSLGH